MAQSIEGGVVIVILYPQKITEIIPYAWQKACSSQKENQWNKTLESWKQEQEMKRFQTKKLTVYFKGDQK